MAAEDSVLDNISQAWDIANSSIDQATDFASNAVTVAKGYIKPGEFNQISLVLPDASGIKNGIDSKLTDIDASVDNTLNSTIPTAYQKLFKDLINQGGAVTSAFGTGEADASDTIALVDGLSEAFRTFNFDGNTATLNSFLSDGIITGGTATVPYGVPIIVENAISDRMVGRLDNEALKAEEEAIAQYAARGFPLPPGAMTRRLCEIRDKANIDKSNAIKDMAIEQGKRAFDASQNYVKQFQDLQNSTADAFNSYLRTVVAARAGASDDVKALINSVSALQDSIVKLYGYTMDERDVLLRQAMSEGQLGNQFLGLEIDSYTKHVEASAGTTMAAAQAMGNLAAAAVSSQNSMSRISADTISST